MPITRAIRVPFLTSGWLPLAIAVVLSPLGLLTRLDAEEGHVRLTLTFSAGTPTEPATDLPPTPVRTVPIEVPAAATGDLEPDFVGAVALRIGADGSVKRVLFESARPSRAIGRALEDALGQWMFAPPTRGGRTVSVLAHALYSRTPTGQTDVPQPISMVLPAYPPPLLRPAGLLIGRSTEARSMIYEPIPASIVRVTTDPTTGKRTTVLEQRSTADLERGIQSPRTEPAAWFPSHVTLRAKLDAGGAVTDIEVLRSTDALFEPRAAAALAATRFSSHAAGGSTAGISLVVPVPIPGELTDRPPDFFHPDSAAGEAPPWDTPPHLQHLALPIYPIDLLKKNVRGIAEARVSLDKSGAIVRTELLGATQPEFGQALLASIAGSSHAPAQREGRRIACTLLRTAVFEPKIETRAPVDGETPAVALRWIGDGKPVDAAALDTPPRTIIGRPPAFAITPTAASAAESATVEMIIDRDGSVYEPRIVRSSGEAAGYAAVQAVAAWLYAPPRLNGMPVPVRTTVTFTSPEQPAR